MDKNGKTDRKYSVEGKAAGVRMGRTLGVGLGTERVSRLAGAFQLGCGVEYVRSWVRQGDIDGR